MTYSNFVSRVSIQRPSPAASAAKPVRPLPKKARKAGRRRVAASLAVAALALCGTGETRADAEPQIIPAPGTMFFAEDPDRPAFVEWTERDESGVFDHPLFEQFKAATAEIRTVAPQRRQQASLLTMILLGGGVGAALCQLRLLRRADLTC